MRRQGSIFVGIHTSIRGCIVLKHLDELVLHIIVEIYHYEMKLQSSKIS